MAFKNFDFTFTPPTTVPSPLPPSSPAPSTAPTVGGATSVNQSKAGSIINQLDDLTGMSQYLQGVILSRTKDMGVEIDPSTDPVTARALTQIYGTDTPPNFITIAMYNHLLNAHLGALQLEMAIGNDSSIQSNPLQVANLAQVVKAVESGLLDNASYKNWLPLQLAALKNDSIFFQSWKQALSTYPAYYSPTPLVPTELQTSTIQATSTDISDSLSDYANDAVSRMGQSYTIAYQSLASPAPAESDLGSIMSQYFTQTLPNMLRIVSLLMSLKTLAQKPAMTSIQNDMVNYSLTRLVSDVSSTLATTDQLMTLGVSPLAGALGSLGNILAASQNQTVSSGVVSGGGLNGMSNSNMCSQSGNPGVSASASASLTVPGLGQVSEGVKELAEMLNWATSTMSKQMSLVDLSFRQMVERKITQQNNRNQIMCSIRALDAMLSLAQAVVSEFQKGTLTSNPTQQQQQEAANSILTSLQTGSSTTFTSSGGQVVVNTPDMPPATTAVQNILAQSGLTVPQGSIET